MKFGKNSKPKTSPRSERRSTLAVVGVLFFLSAGFRIATDAGQVIAKEASPGNSEAATTSANNLDLARPEKMTAVLAAVKDREARLIEREAEIDVREQTVQAAENAIEDELKKLRIAEQNLRQTITLASEAAESDVKQLTDMYADMKPKQAAVLFEQMDAGFAAGFLARMPSESAAKILAGMTPEQAYLISVKLAGRNAEIPMR